MAFKVNKVKTVPKVCVDPQKEMNTHLYIDKNGKMYMNKKDGTIMNIGGNNTNIEGITREDYDALSDKQNNMTYFVYENGDYPNSSVTFSLDENDMNKMQDYPVGSTISVIGTSTPNHYLKCDGKEYFIKDYQKLADYINNQFGSYNYFGGNGLSTFAVPTVNSDNDTIQCIKYEPTYYSNIDIMTMPYSYVEEILFDGYANIMGNTYELSKDVSAYDYVDVYGRTDNENADAKICVRIRMKDALSDSGSNINELTSFLTTTYNWTILFYFVDGKNILINNIASRGVVNPGIYKIVGIKNGGYDDTDIQEKVENLFQSVSDGSKMLETAIADKNGIVSKKNNIATFSELKEGISSIDTSEGIKFNIYTQLNEPENKNGVWFKTTESYKDVSMLSSELNYTAATLRFYTEDSHVGGRKIFALDDDNIIVFNVGYGSYTYKYTISTNSMTSIVKSSGESFVNSESAMIFKDKKIYAWGSTTYGTWNTRKFRVLDPYNNTITGLPSMPFDFYGEAVLDNNENLVHLFNGGNAQHYVYDFRDGSYTKKIDVPLSSGGCGMAFNYNGTIYVFCSGKNGEVFKYNIAKDTYTQLENYIGEMGRGSYVIIGEKIYITDGISNYIYKYDPDSDSYTKFYTADSRMMQMCNYNDTIYSIKYGNTMMRFTPRAKVESVCFDDKSKENIYNTKIFNSNYDLIMNQKVCFGDVFITDKNGKDMELETYIGNGSSWIKIRDGKE